MKKINVLMVAILFISVLAINPEVQAQTKQEIRTNSTAQYVNDRNPNYGWVGLLGLIGLAGFIKRNHYVKETPISNTPKYNS